MLDKGLNPFQKGDNYKTIEIGTRVQEIPNLHQITGAPEGGQSLKKKYKNAWKKPLSLELQSLTVMI